MNILIVEDDSILASQIAHTFESRIISNRIRILHSPIEFVREIHLIDAYDIILTDLQLSEDASELWGYKVIQLIRERDMDKPIIVISGRGEINTLRKAFDLGANDYLIKPLRLKELELRVINWFRQYNFLGIRLAGRIYNIRDLEYDLDKNEFYRNGEKLRLTRTNKYLLSVFFSHSGKVLHDEFLREKIWGDRTAIIERNLRVSILRLKKSLEKYGLSNWINNVRGEGYIFEPR